MERRVANGADVRVAVRNPMSPLFVEFLMTMKGGSMQKHLTVLGLLLIVVGAFTLIGAGATFLSMAGGALMSATRRSSR
jgi:hypothetical protein